MKNVAYCSVVSLCFLLLACMHKPMIQQQIVPDECIGITPTFDKEVRPIFKNSCAKSGCHDGKEMPIDFGKYENILPYLEDSGIYYSVIVNQTMPQDAPLDAAELKLIKCWLQNGFPEK